MANSNLLPGYGFVQETASAVNLYPGYGLVQETVSAADGGTSNFFPFFAE